MVYYGNPWLSRFANSNLTASGEQLLSETQPVPSQGYRVAASISFHFCSICRCQKLASYLTYKGIWGILLLISMYINDDFKALLQSYFPHAINPCYKLSEHGSTSVELDRYSPVFKIYVRTPIQSLIRVPNCGTKRKQKQKSRKGGNKLEEPCQEISPLPPHVSSIVSCSL